MIMFNNSLIPFEYFRLVQIILVVNLKILLITKIYRIPCTFTCRATVLCSVRKLNFDSLQINERYDVEIACRPIGRMQ